MSLPARQPQLRQALWLISQRDPCDGSEILHPMIQRLQCHITLLFGPLSDMFVFLLCHNARRDCRDLLVRRCQLRVRHTIAY